jgi:hypothetical protein
MSGYDLANKDIGDLQVDASPPAANDLFVRFDESTGNFVKVDAMNLLALLNINATAAEIDNAADVSGRIVSIADATNTISLTQALHANRTVLTLDASLAITLPEATGTGDAYKIVLGIAATAVTIVTADTANAGFYGQILAYDDDVDTDLNSWNALPGVSDTITFNGTATGGKIYDHIELVDIATDKWLVSGQISESGGSEVTPFSSAA